VRRRSRPRRRDPAVVYPMRYRPRPGLRSDQGATDTDVAMMRRALELARDAAARGEAPIGAVVYETESGRVLGEGSNTRESERDALGHAELIAIRRASGALGDWRLNACTLCVTLEPCPMCAGAIVQSRVGRLVFGARDPKAGATGSLYELTEDPRLNHRVRPIGGVLAAESSALLRSFFRARRVEHSNRNRR